MLKGCRVKVKKGREGDSKKVRVSLGRGGLGKK